ncbi:MAG: hypothetical protein WC708_06200 [Lentisphaeria bacterium]
MNTNGIQSRKKKQEKSADAAKEWVKVDFTKEMGKIKPLHGVNNSPVVLNGEIPTMRDAGIPYVRLHDAAGGFGGTYYVDVPNLFPDFNADPENAASYDFAFNDAYFRSLIASGVKIFYRLGVTIENFWQIKVQRINPPEDFKQWARICEGIIRHYNHGWANGFHYGIEYWEIWNEPENPPMWTGSREQFFRFYGIVANHLKKCFPEIKVGGYGSCGFYEVTRKKLDDFYLTFIPYFTEFLEYISAPKTRAPLDFFSWHLYPDDPAEIVNHAVFVDKMLKKYGFVQTENIFDEWNFATGIYGGNPWDDIKEMPGATFVASSLCLMQKSPIDKAMYYDAFPERIFCGLYYFPSMAVTKTFFAFFAFNELYKLGTAVECSSDIANKTYACAARGDKNQSAVLIVNYSTSDKLLYFDVKGGNGNPEFYLLDKWHLLSETPSVHPRNGELTMPKLSVVLVKFR